jgi:Co/Zn/Cd efflux system component
MQKRLGSRTGTVSPRGYCWIMTAAVRHTHVHYHGSVGHTHEHEHLPGEAHDDPAAHEHGHHVHEHDHARPVHDREHGEHGPGRAHHDYDEHGHGHSHGLVDRSVVRSRAGVKAVGLSLGVLGAAAVAQALILATSGSVALLADLIHNVGDALTAIPLGIAFLLRSYRGEKLAGLAVVAVIFFSACVALYESIQRLLHPQTLTHLWVLAAAGVIGFVGNEIAAQVRLRAGRRLHSPALIADGNHARVDGFVSLAVVASAALVAAGAPRADPLIGLAMVVVILKITWDSWRVVSSTEPGEIDHPHAP